MVGIVIISHSGKVAEGVREIALQMAPDVPMAACGGTKDGGIGTDPDRILAGINSVDGEEGVILFADLGSAVMSSELILDSLDPIQGARTVIANAPLVEGVVLAAVESLMGSSLRQVLATAESAANMTKVEREG